MNFEAKQFAILSADHRQLCLKLLQAAGDAGNVARACRHFGISRKTFYKSRGRYQTQGDIGLADRARRAA
jgi:hypothetical protein